MMKAKIAHLLKNLFLPSYLTLPELGNIAEIRSINLSAFLQDQLPANCYNKITEFPGTDLGTIKLFWLSFSHCQAYYRNILIVS